jgi:hypothetical protein
MDLHSTINVPRHFSSESDPIHNVSTSIIIPLCLSSSVDVYPMLISNYKGIATVTSVPYPVNEPDISTSIYRLKVCGPK